jgi:DNA invertase Pin-like site-specific DNA recombinase
MLIGYARVSTQDQNLDLQIDALTNAGCKKIFHENTSGSRAERPEFSKAREALRKGDTLVVCKLDRLGRSVKNLVDLVGELHNQGIQFKSLTDVIDTGTPSGRFFFQEPAHETEKIVHLKKMSIENKKLTGIKGRQSSAPFNDLH